MSFDLFWQITRYAMLVGGGIAVGKGWMSDEQLSTIIAAIGVLCTTGWGIWVKYNTRTVTAATAARPDVPTVSSATGAVEK